MDSIDPLRVAIVGAGPGGCACALALLAGAAQRGRQVEVHLIEGKQFAGEQHHNQCAGVLSPPLPELLTHELGIPFPDHLVRGKVDGYVLHVDSERLTLPSESEPSRTLRRVQFDAYMLNQAMRRGAQVLHARASDLEFHNNHVALYTEAGTLEAEVVVGAFGMDEGSAAMFARNTPYRPPKALASVVTKYHPGEEGMRAFGSHIHAFLPRHRHIEFAAVTPKGNHLTINIAGQEVTAEMMEEFLQRPEVQQVLPNFDLAGRFDPNDLRFFKGRFPRSLARGYFGERYVILGDAAGLVRAFKGKGVTAAVQTGIRAAQAILQAGVTKAAFAASYGRANEDIRRDLPYGRLARMLVIHLARWGLFPVVLRAAERHNALRQALFGAVSGESAYREVLRTAFSPPTLWAVLRAWLP